VTTPSTELVVRATLAVRRSALWWTVGIVALALVTVAFWPSLEGTDALRELGGGSEDFLEAFGAQNIASPDGYLDGQLYALMLPLLLSGMAIAHVTGLTSGDEDAGRLELLHALPVRRRAVWVTRFAAVTIVQLVVAAIASALVALSLGPFSFDEVGAGSVVAATMACGLLAVFHAGVGFLAAALGCRRGLAAGMAVLVLVAGYVLSFIVPLAEGLSGARRWSPWDWALGPQPVSDGVSPARLALLAVVTAVLVVAGLVAIEHRDIRPA
jgi:ABC-2 type transport system permease protein